MAARAGSTPNVKPASATNPKPAANSAPQPTGHADFAVSSTGEVFPIPKNGVAQPTDNGRGTVWKVPNGMPGGGNGLASSVTEMRVTGASPSQYASDYPNGYVAYGARQTPTIKQPTPGVQPVQPYTGKPVSNSDPWRHIVIGGSNDKI